VSCLFYGRAIGWWGDSDAVFIAPEGPDPPGNRCALITSAHSPCWMEVGEQRPPDWSECVRNPEVVAELVRLGPMSEGFFRMANQTHALAENMRMRSTPT
jgi:hypothetical protein